VPNGLALRKSVDTLSDSELASLRNAYARMMQIADNRGYNFWAGFHGVPGNYCWHAPRFILGRSYNLFLPWHRAYIRYFELAAQDQDSDAVLPWWDWTLGRSIPASFSTPTVDGESNPLYKAHIYVPDANPPLDRDTRRFPGEGVPDTVRLPTAEEIAALYSITQFQEFSNALQDIHNRIHGWTGGISQENGQLVGGDMGSVATAAYDPIFWSHHCMIDRIWYLWQIRNGVNNIPVDYLSQILTPFRYTVRDVLNIGTLGYDYAVSGITFEA
jgi:tyrosinase